MIRQLEGQKVFSSVILHQDRQDIPKDRQSNSQISHMLPPRYPKSSRGIQNQQGTSPSTPYPNNQRQLNTYRQKYQQSSDLNSLQSRSRVSRYQHLRTPQQKRKALGRHRYINQLAYLDYEQKYIEIYTKYTMASKLTAMKKIKAKNQMAQFIEEQEQEELGFEELMDFKYGRQSDNQKFFFEKSQLMNEYQFCCQCDTIHNDHPQVHQKICKDKHLSSEQCDTKFEHYVYFSLQRIQHSLKRTSGQQFDTLKEIIKTLIKIQQRGINHQSNRLQIQSSELEKQLKYIYELYNVNCSDTILKVICEKIMKRLYKRAIR